MLGHSGGQETEGSIGSSHSCRKEGFGEDNIVTLHVGGTWPIGCPVLQCLPPHA